MQFWVISSLLATVAMVTSQQDSSTLGSQVTAQQCVTRWSDWINNDKPDTDGGDYEQMTSAEKAAFCPGGFVNRAECETVTGTAFNSSGEMSVSCTVTEGLRCNNADNAPIQCSDFRIRYRCRCPAELASTPITATDDVITTQATSPTTEVTAVVVPSEINGSSVIAPVVTFPPDTTPADENSTEATTSVETPTFPTAEIITSTPSEAENATIPTASTPAPPDTIPTESAIPAVTVTSPPTVSETNATGETSTPVATTPEAVIPTTPRPYVYPTLDEILEAFRKLTQTEYFQRLSAEDQTLLLELTTGGQTGEITQILNLQGWERVLSFMYGMPLNYFDTLMQFVLASFERERLFHAAA